MAYADLELADNLPEPAAVPIFRLSHGIRFPENEKKKNRQNDDGNGFPHQSLKVKPGLDCSQFLCLFCAGHRSLPEKTVSPDADFRGPYQTINFSLLYEPQFDFPGRIDDKDSKNQKPCANNRNLSAIDYIHFGLTSFRQFSRPSLLPAV
jgi:hypothetical protein